MDSPVVPPMDFPVVPCAASTLAPGWLHQAEVPARVLSSFPGAAYLLPVGATPAPTPDRARRAVDPDRRRAQGAADVLALVGPGALRLPGAVLVPHDGLLRSGLGQGDTVLVGGGRVRAPSAVLEVRRAWTPGPVEPADLLEPRRCEAVRRAVHEIDASPYRPGRPDLGLLAADVLQDPAQVVRLLGLGPGLTPSGDDVLAGLLLGLRAAGLHEDRRASALATEVADGLWRTTALSGTLLRAAALGHAAPPVVDLLTALRRPAPVDRVGSLVRAVAVTGHSSGADLLVGVRTVLARVLADAPARPHPRPATRAALALEDRVDLLAPPPPATITYERA